MPHEYDPKSKRFIFRDRSVPLAAVRKEIDALTKFVAKEAERIAKNYAAGKITAVEFEIEMRELLKSGHIIAASVGRGGRSRMTASDWGKVGARLKVEYGYLQRFVTKLQKGKIDKAFTPYRASKYSSSIVMAYHETVKKEHTQSRTSIKVKLVRNAKESCDECVADSARGWVNVEDMSELGERICGNFCKCYLIFSDDVEAGRVNL